jgi:hypothetical protein
MASDKAATTVPSIVSNIGHVKTGNLLQGGNSRTFRPNLSSPLSDGLLPVLESGGIAGKADDELRVEDVNEVDDYIMFDDDGIPEQGDADDQDISETESEEGPDLSVLDLYLKLFKLRANPLGLARFSREERVQIELLQLLRDLKCPLKAFTLVLKWAAKSNGSGHSFREGFQPTREKVIANLFERYNMKGLIPKEKKLYLPYTQRTVSLIFFDASEVFASLLSCPTLNQDGNYFFDKAKDPFVAPETSSHVGDIHTGRCYRKTYDALIKKPDVDMLLPCIMAMDKTYIDMAGRLQMEPITISHGLLNHSIRRLPIAMRILGYINHSTPAHLPSDSEIDAEFNAPADLPKGTARVEDPLRCPKDVSWSTLILNETHMQIQFILEESGFLRLQNHGFRWDLSYNGKIHPVVFHPYVPFIIGDTEGHDRLCGHYTARFSQIQQLCRICECPTYLSGYSKSNFRHRVPKKIDALVSKGHTVELQLLSQNYLKNGFAEVRFGLHNQRGIFGACPGEMLHLISLGWFKYCLQAFSAQAGPNSNALKQYDVLCAKLGRSLSRQSDRDIPRTNFPKGFSSGSNLMGHEMTGCLLVTLFALHTTYFRGIFEVGKKVAVVGDDQRFRYENHIQDWIGVVTSLLVWHQWMKQPMMSKKMVKRSHTCLQWLMRVVAEVAPRPGAMGNNTIKTHLVLHLCEDILDHGVPDNVNSAYAESAHIPLAKATSRNTQKRAISFTKQAANRYTENLVISLASTDVENDVKRNVDSSAADVDTPLSDGKGGRRFYLAWEEGNERATFRWTRPRSGDNLEMAHLSHRVTAFLSRHCLPKMPKGELPCFTSFNDEDGNNYRAHPCYDGKAWNDYAMIEWEGYPQPEPVFIHTFVDLRGLPKGDSIDINSNGQTKLTAGLYAVAHSFNPVDEGDLNTPNTLIGHYTPHFHSFNDRHPTLFLVDVESIRSPVLGIPDVQFGVKPPMNERHYLFLIRRKAEWPRAWDSLINRCHHDLEHDVDDDTWFEEEYEKDELINRLPSGREIYSVKTPEDFAAEVAAEKAEKVAAKKKKEHAAAEKASAKAAKAAENPGKNSSAPASTAQRLAGNFKRKRVAPAKTGKG